MVCFSNTIYKSPREIFSDDTLPQEKGCYLAAAAVSSLEKGTGLYSRMNEKRILTATLQKLPLIFTRTQNPLVETGIIKQLQKFQNKGLIKSFTLQRKLVPGAYGQMLTKTEPKKGERNVQNAYEKLNMKNGDAFILFFRITYR